MIDIFSTNKSKIFFFFLFLYVFTSQGSIQSSDGMSMFKVTESIVERGSLAVKSEREDIFKTSSDGKKYSKYGIGMSVFAVPFYLIGFLLSKVISENPFFVKQFVSSFFNPVVTAISTTLIYSIGEKLGYLKRSCLLLSILFGTCSLSWVYIQDFFSQPLIVLFELAAINFIFSEGISHAKGAFFAGVIMGFALLTRLDTLVVVPVFVLYILFRKSRNMQWGLGVRKSLPCFLSFIIPVVLAGIVALEYNQIRFGLPFSTGGYAGELGTTVQGFFISLFTLLFSLGKGFFIYNPIFFSFLYRLEIPL